MKIFVDCDVLLDVGLKREPFYLASGTLLDYLERNKNIGFIAWHSIANFFYITAKYDNKQQSKRFIAELCGFLTIVPVSNQDLLAALNLPFNDFEDAMQCASAMACNANVLVSRNIKDYQNSPIRAVTLNSFYKNSWGKMKTKMNRTEIERAIVKETHSLPLDKVEATLNFVLSLKNQPVTKRSLGLLKGKVEFAIEEGFKMTDEAFLHS